MIYRLVVTCSPKENFMEYELNLNSDTLLLAFEKMATARQLSDLYEANAKVTSKYVHATSRGHEACQIALGLQLTKDDYLSAYYRDDSILLSIGMTPYELMLQLFAKKDDPFSGEERITVTLH